tara:strand:- start:440 stop:697 length:258 start_codon:yes stop_codon:yes gene_type:complete
MDSYYEVHQCHAPSGGVGPVDDTQYDTVEEARGAAEAMASETGVLYTHDFGGGKISTYPTFWAQRVDIVDGIHYIWTDVKARRRG